VEKDKGFESIQFEKFDRTKSKFFSFFLIFLGFLMIRFNRIELATYLDRPLDPIDFKAREARFRVIEI
jgi:hypothetical protein